jgi:hypothetical protein
MIGERRRETRYSGKLAELSDAAGPGERKNHDSVQFPVSCPQAAPPRRGSAIGRSCIVATWEVKSPCITVGARRLSAYILPAASRDVARRAWGNPSCYCPTVTGVSDTVDSDCRRDWTAAAGKFENHGPPGRVEKTSCVLAMNLKNFQVFFPDSWRTGPPVGSRPHSTAQSRVGATRASGCQLT